MGTNPEPCQFKKTHNGTEQNQDRYTANGRRHRTDVNTYVTTIEKWDT